MIVKAILKKKRYEPYLEEGITLKSGIVDFRLMFKDLIDEQKFERIMYALTDAIENTVRDFEKAFILGRGY